MKRLILSNSTPFAACAILLMIAGLVWPTLRAAPVELVAEDVHEIKKLKEGVYLVDFARVAFGNLKLIPPAGSKGTITVRFGENLKNGRVDRKPPGTVRFAEVSTGITGGTVQIVSPPADQRNTQKGNGRTPPAILTPAEWGVVIPFRWAEIEGWPGVLGKQQIQRQSAFSSDWDDAAAKFESSDEMLNQIWDFCRYSIKATTFAGVFVDGDRERIPYEADAYLNQLSYYYTTTDVKMARDTFDHLMKHGTWPTEWAPHMVMMAHADWMQTGDLKWLESRYESLKGKMLMERVGPDGLITSTPQQIQKGDIVDWPNTERDGYVFKPINTVVNAFHLHAVRLMKEMAGALGKDADAMVFGKRHQETSAVFQAKFFDRKTGRYRDGVGTDHSSLHANLFPLAFDLVPVERRDLIAEWLVKRGMACSVYAAQYYMEALFENGQAEAAVELMMAPGDRSWRHMVDSGATISWEAWDLKYKPNQDWNHAWGAAPANLLPRYVLGVEAQEPGWEKALIRPMPGGLSMASGKVPTVKGPIVIAWEAGKEFQLKLSLPEGVKATVDLPAPAESKGVYAGNEPVAATRKAGRWVIDEVLVGEVDLSVR